MRPLFFLTILLLFTSCRNSETPNKNKHSEAISEYDLLTPEQTDFITNWSNQFNTQKAPLLCLFRSRHLNKTDLKQLDSYVKGQESAVDFQEAKAYLETKSELSIDTLRAPGIQWVKDEDVSTCNKVDPIFWDCFSRRYPITGFYYLSMPLFSADKKWCLLSVNYLSKQKGDSFGGGRLYHLENNKWNEVAFLSFWGKQPE
jgi:hypothetical protein